MQYVQIHVQTATGRKPTTLQNIGRDVRIPLQTRIRNRFDRFDARYLKNG
jgi:hypothetical protein